MSRFDDLVARSRERAQADPGWLGSDQQLALLRDSLEPVFGVANASVVWGSPGEAGSWDPENRQITLPRPTGTVDERPDAAEVNAVSLLHECLHARYSTRFRRFASFARRRRALPGGLQREVDRPFHVLEDARVIPLAVADDPTLDPVLRKIAREGVDGYTAAARTVDSGEGPLPKSQHVQAEFAIEVYAIDPTRELTLHPMVARLVDSMKPTVDRTRSGDTESCAKAAIKITPAIARSRLEMQR